MRFQEVENNWSGLIEGDEKTFEQVYLAYFDALYNYGKKYTRHTELIEDAIHDLFLRIWKNRKNLHEPSSLKNYLYKAFRNHLNDKLIAGNKYVLSESDTDSGSNFDFVLSAEHIRISMEQEEHTSKRLTAAIAELTSRQREAIFLRFYEEFSYPEVASILDLSVKATYKLMARAIDSLREILGSHIVGILIVHAIRQVCQALHLHDKKKLNTSGVIFQKVPYS